MCDAEKLVTQLPWWEREYDHDLIELQHVKIPTTKIAVPWLIRFGCNSHISLVWLSDLRVIRVHASGAIT